MLIRYAGSKDRATGRILEKLDLSGRKLCEPFAGTAAVVFAAIDSGLVDHVWVNDADPHLADLWLTVRDKPERLIELINGYTPRAQDFYDFKAEGVTASPVRNAFTTIVLHQISFGGLGRQAGSPIGGARQTGKYLVGCRWNADRLTSKIELLHKLLDSVETVITCGEWASCPPWAWYVDPPYVGAGEDLYRQSGIDHFRLMLRLQAKPQPWVLSYNDNANVRSLYSWATIENGHDTYLNHGRKRTDYRKTELLITPRGDA